MLMAAFFAIAVICYSVALFAAPVPETSRS
jgi:hypothetical protein